MTTKKTSKRITGQLKRRKMRRALNASEAFKALGVSKAMRLGCGEGLASKSLRERPSPRSGYDEA